MKTLLIIEDDETFAMGLARALVRREYSCVIAPTLLEAEDILSQNPTDCILMDLNLKGTFTQNSISRFRSLCPKSTIVILTGHGTIPSAVNAIKDGADSYLTKPATPDDIDKALSQKKLNLDPTPLWDLENHHISEVLEDCGGNISEAARKLGLHRRTLQRRLKKI